MLRTRSKIDSVHRRAQHAMIQWQAAWEITGNPLYVWCGLWWCLSNGRDLPKWIAGYLQHSSDALMKAARDTKVMPSARRSKAAKALKLAG